MAYGSIWWHHEGRQRARCSESRWMRFRTTRVPVINVASKVWLVVSEGHGENTQGIGLAEKTQVYA